MQDLISDATVLVPEPIGSSGLAQLERAGCRLIAPWRSGGEATFDALRAELAVADAVIVRLFPMGRTEISSAPRLRAIAKAGVGVDNIDLAAAAERGVAVLWAPGANSNAVAEHTLALMFALCRQTVAAHDALRSGVRYTREQFLGPELHGKTLLVVGLGRVGSRVAEKAGGGLGMRVLAHDPYVDAGAYRGPAVFVDVLDDCLPEVDFVTLHVPLTDETRGMIDADRLALLPPSARVINTSRGAVIDESALVDALHRGGCAGAALDVFTQEPLPAGHPLTLAPRTVLTPHIAGMTPEAFEASARASARGVLDVLSGREPEHVVSAD